MRFLTLATHLLPVLALGGLVSGNDNGGESLHRPFNDSVYDLNDNSAGTRNMNRPHPVTEELESQFTTPIAGEQSLQRSAFDEKGSDSIMNDNHTPAMKLMDNFEGPPTRQFSDDTDDNVPEDTTKSTGKYDEATYPPPAMLRTLNTTHDQQNQTDLGTMLETSSLIPDGKETNIRDSSSAPPSSLQPQFSDETESGTGKINSNIQSTVGPITTEDLPIMELSRKGKPVINTDDVQNDETLIKNQNWKANKTVLSDSILPEAVFAKPAHAEAAQEKEGISNKSDQSSSTLNNSYENRDAKSIDDKIQKKGSSDIGAEDSGTEKSENWLSVLQSMVPSQKERLDFNEKMLQSIQNTVSNSNVNHNVMNNAPAVPCSHSIPPSSSNSYPSSQLSSDPMPISPAGIPFEVEMPEGYSDFGIESHYPYIENTDVDEHGLRKLDQFVDPLNGWSVQPIDTQFNPIIHIEGNIMIHGLSQQVRPTRRCRRILMRPEPICKREKPVCHALSNGSEPVCRPGRVICKENPSQKPRVKLVCKRVWERERFPRQRFIYSVPSYVSPDYELIDDQVDSVYKSQNDRSILETNDCNHGTPETLPTPLTFGGVSDVDDEAPDQEDDTGVSEEVFEEAILKAINEAPEILAPEPNEGLESKAVQTLRPEPLISTGKPSTEVSKPSPSLLARKKPFPIVNHNTDANNKADKLPIAQSEVPLKSVIEKETAPNSGAKTTNNSANDNINHNVNTNVNTNVNSNTDLNLNGNNVAALPVLPTVQIPAISPVASPVIPVEPSKSNENLNANSNINTNLNVNQNHNVNVNDNVRLPMPPTVQPKLNKSTETPQANPAMPTFEYNRPSENAQDINAVNQNANTNVNSNTNINQQQNVIDQIEVPHQKRIEPPLIEIIPQAVEPVVIQPSIEATASEPLAKKLEQNANANANVNSNVNINHNSNMNNNAREPVTPNIEGIKVVSVDENPIVLPNVVLPSINQASENANVNANMNVNRNTNINGNQNLEPMIQKVDEKVPISIPEPIQVAEAPVEVVAPIYEVPLLPASLNVNSNVNQNINNNVNANSIDNRMKNTEQQQQQQLPKEPINQSMPLITSTKPTTSEPILVHVVSDSVDDAPKISHQNVNENLNKNVNVNVNGNQNINHGTVNQAAQFSPEIIPIVVPQSVPTPILANVPTLHGNSNRDANINHNVNSNVNINSNGNAAVNAAELPNHDVPVLVREPRPVAVLSEPTTREVMPVAPVLSQISQDRNVNSNANFNFNSNVNNNANQMIAVPSRQPDPPIIKPVESQPVAEPNRTEIPPLNTARNDPRQDVNENENANVNKNVNVNANVNTNRNVNSNGNYDTREKQIQEVPEAAREAVVIPKFTEPTVTQSTDNNDGYREPKENGIPKADERTTLNKNHNMDVNVNRNSNVNVNKNRNLNRNDNIKNRGQSLLTAPPPAAVLSQEPILPSPQAKDPVSPLGTILGPQVLQTTETDANYAANVNVNHNSNSNVNFNQNHQIKGQEPILSPPLTPSAWIQPPVLQREIIPNIGFNTERNSNVNLNKNSNTNINQNVNLNQNHNIVSREPSGLPAGREYFNTNNYVPVLQPDAREPVMIAAPTPLIEEKKSVVPQVIRNAQINANHNANVNMNYNSNYNHNANYNGGTIVNPIKDNGKVPLINPHQNVSPPVIIPQSPNRGTGLWNSEKNSNINANYNSNMNFNSNVNANSNYNSNIGQSGLGTVPSGSSGTRETNPGMQTPLFTGNPVIDTPKFSNIKSGTPTQLGYNAQQNIDSNANYNSNLNYNSNYNANYNHNANYNAQLKEEQKTPKRKGWYELWYNNGDDKDGWTEIWNNKQFKRFLEQQLKDMKQQEDIQAQAQAQAFTAAR